MQKQAKVLIYDLETSYIITEEKKWSLWDERPLEQNIIQDWQILSVAWKWLGEKKVHVLGQDDFIDYVPGKLNDKNVVEFIHGLFDTADIVIAHNGDSFDQKKAQARMIVHGMAPPAPYKQLDTKKLFKKYANFTSNSLGNLAKALDVAQKGSPGGIATWTGCMEGDRKAWKLMKKYNKQDIPPLEDLYMKIRPWIQNHPNMALLTDNREGCPNCGKGPLQRRGVSMTKVGVKRRVQCQNCATWSYERQVVKTSVAYTN